jgi:hypothetical protein
MFTIYHPTMYPHNGFYSHNGQDANGGGSNQFLGATWNTPSALPRAIMTPLRCP